MSNLSEEEIYKMLLNENVEKFPLLNEIFAIRNNKFKINDYTIYVTGCISLDVINIAIEKVNLIDRLQKENEFLKAPFEYANGNTLDKRYVEMNFVSKDKIKEQIQVFKKEGSQTSLIIASVLGDLLKEK